MHVLLRIGERNGKPEFEPIHVDLIEGNRYRVLFSPGLAYGLAAQDEIEPDDEGRYEVVARGGNLAVRVLSSNGVTALEPALTEQVAQIGGRLDGRVRNGLAYTIPAKTGRETIGQLFGNLKRETPGVLWEYGNVYEEDGQVAEWLRGDASYHDQAKSAAVNNAGVDQAGRGDAGET